MRRPVSLLAALFAVLIVLALAGCGSTAPQATGPMLDGRALQDNYQKAMGGLQAVNVANGKGDTNGARAEFTGNFAPAWKVIAPAVSAKDAAAYKKLNTAFEELQDEFNKAQPRRAEIEEKIDILLDNLRQVAPSLGIQGTTPTAEDPATLFKTALTALGDLGVAADKGDWAKARTEFTQFNVAAMSLRGQIEAKDKALAAQLNGQLDTLEKALQAQSPDKATVQAAVAAATNELKQGADKLSVKL